MNIFFEDHSDKIICREGIHDQEFLKNKAEAFLKVLKVDK